MALQFGKGYGGTFRRCLLQAFGQFPGSVDQGIGIYGPPGGQMLQASGGIQAQIQTGFIQGSPDPVQAVQIILQRNGKFPNGGVSPLLGPLPQTLEGIGQIAN